MMVLRRHRKKFVFWALLLWGGLMIGCGAHTKEVKTPQEPARPKTASPPPEEPAITGSLWSQQSPMGSLFSDLKARGVGDIVTISIVESSSATESAGTDTSRDSSVNAALNNFLGLENELVKNFRHLDKASLIDATLATEFEGAGKTVRSGQLTASITAKIIDVLPTGNFVIEGRREVEVNHENQYIVISGIIRPEDISPDNIVLSTYISDARITYSGRGVVNDTQRPGWFTGFVNRVWPF